MAHLKTIFLIIFLSFFIGSNFSTTDNKKPWSVSNLKTNQWIETKDYFKSFSIEFLDKKNSFVNIQVFEDGEIYYLEPDSELLELDQTFSELVNLPKKTNKFYLHNNSNIKIHFYPILDNKIFVGANKYIEGLKIISRDQWGADETIRYDYSDESYTPSLNGASKKCGSIANKYPKEFKYSKVVTHNNGHRLLWPQQYSPQIKKIVVHHTAESNRSDSIPGGDRIKSIYYYHAHTLKWGDIGYNFLIDPQGNIYEGRAGGDYVVGGHVYCNNIGTIGVSLMGNFNVKNPSKPQIKALSDLLTALAKKYRLNLNDKNFFHGEKTEILLGHRDLGKTACPGDNLYSILPLLRKNFSLEGIDFGFNNKDDLRAISDYGAKLYGKPTVIKSQALTQKKITLAFKNTGKVTWKTGTWLYSPNNNSKNLWADPIVIDKDYVVATMEERMVPSGFVGHFSLTINTGISAGTHTLEVVPIINGQRKMNSSAVLLAVNINNTNFDYEFVKAENPKNPNYFGHKIKASVVLKNTGNTTWYRSGPFAITLDAPFNQKSDFASPLAPHTYAWLKETEVKPNQNGEFMFELYTGFKEGTFEVPFIPRIGKEKYLKDVGMKFHLKVEKPVYRAQILYDKKIYEFLPKETRKVKLGLKNLSNTVWQENQISLRVVDSDEIDFKYNSFVFPNEVKKMDSDFIYITLTAPEKTGKYQAKFQALANQKKFNKTRFLYLPIKVLEASLDGEITYLSDKKFDLDLGKMKEVILRIKNNGNLTWKKKGENSVYLKSYTPNNLLKAYDWQSDNIVSFMEESEVIPGKVATFRFHIRKNRLEEISSYFGVYHHTLGLVTNSRFDLTIIGDKKTNQTENISDKIQKKRSKTYQELLEKLRTERARRKARIKNAKQKIEDRRKEKQEETIKNNTNSKNIRVKLSFNEKSANILTHTNSQIILDNKKIFSLKKSDSLWVRKDNNNLIVSINGQKFWGDVLRIIPDTYNVIYNWNRFPAWNPDIKDNKFKGVLEIRLDNNKMIIINDISLNEYLKGIAEVPEKEPQEKKKALAVLARSYARHYLETEYKKYPDKPYDASDDPNTFQKYLGYNYVLRSPQWQEALKSTENEIITYQGEILRTAYFSCSNGKTKTPLEANWTQGYFQKVADVYQSVDDTFGKDMLRYNKGQCGHLVGLSGKGAEYLASIGKSYQEIINYYYQNIKFEKNK
jgi:hypothetical protein